MSKRRAGKPTRRRLEFEAILHHVRKNKPAFIARLQRQCRTADNGECVLWTGSAGARGYGRDTFRVLGTRITIDSHRLFLILTLGRPIGAGMEAGHDVGCPHALCVRHVTEQHWTDNLRQQARKARGDGCPF